METISFESLDALAHWIYNETNDNKEREKLMLDGVSNRTWFGKYFIRRPIIKHRDIRKQTA